LSKVVAFAESTWMDPKTDRRMWNQLGRAYGVTTSLWDQWDPPDDAQSAVVLVDQRGATPLTEFEHPVEATYVFGRTGMNRMLQEIQHDHSVRIDTPHPISLFGISAAAIVLADREAKLQ